MDVQSVTHVWSPGSPGGPCVALASGQAATTSTLEVLTQLPSTTIVPIWSVAAPTAAYRYLSLSPVITPSSPCPHVAPVP